MDEYIKKQAAIEQFKSVAEQQTLIHDLNRRRFEFKDIVEVIGRIPPADVRPVVRGKWEVVDWVKYDGHGECVHYPKEGLCCTNCKNVFKKDLLWKDNYCPNCGADMRSEKEDK